MEEEAAPGIWELILTVQEQHGLSAAILLLIVLALFGLLYKLIWKVWSSAMKSKDDEIERLVRERDKYQKLVFERLLTSAADLGDSNDEV